MSVERDAVFELDEQRVALRGCEKTKRKLCRVLVSLVAIVRAEGSLLTMLARVYRGQ